MTFIFLSHNSIGQKDRIDSLIKWLDNSQVALGGDFAGPEVSFIGEPSMSIYNIGKEATKSLVMILDDSSKGIIAHIILTWIWEKTERPKTILIEKDTITVYTYNKLNFFVRRKEIYANKRDLTINKIFWQDFLKENSR